MAKTVRNITSNDDIRRAAILGYQQQLEGINAKIADLRRQLGPRRIDSPALGSAGPARRTRKKKNRISPEGRARIAEAQRRRWAAAKEQAGEVSTTVKRSSKD